MSFYPGDSVILASNTEDWGKVQGRQGVIQAVVMKRRGIPHYLVEVDDYIHRVSEKDLIGYESR